MLDQDGAGGEIDHPEIVDVGRFERLGGTVLQAAGAQAAAVDPVLAQQVVDRRDRREEPDRFQQVPVGVEHLDRDLRALGDLVQYPGGGGLVEHPAGTLVGSDFGHQGVKAVFLISVIPVLQGADAIKVAHFVGPGARRCVAQSLGERPGAADLVQDVRNGRKPEQGRRL